MPAAGQRWARPIDVEPGHWKKQLPGKSLRIAAKGDVDALRRLLAANPEDLNRRANHGRTLLWEAVKAGKQEAVQFLVDAGADVELTGCYNSESHVQLTPYCAAVYYRRAALADYLKARSHAPDLFRQAFLGNTDSVIGQIKADRSLLGLEDPHDEIFFMPMVAFAVAGGHCGLTEGVIALGAEIEVYSGLLLFLAAKIERIDLIDVLVDAGADTHFIETALISTKDMAAFRRLLERHRSLHGEVPPRGLTLVPIVRGDRAERPDKVAALLDHGVPVDATDKDGKTALHFACRAVQLKVINLLIERGADPSVKDNEGHTARDSARIAGKAEAVTLLKGRGVG